MTDKQKQFLILRANGQSFDKISKQLKVSKPTLIQWSKLFENELNDLKFQSLADLKEQYQFSVKAKYEQLLKHLAKIDEAISSIDLKNATIKELFIIRNDLVQQLEAIEKQTYFIQTGLTKQCEFTGEHENINIKLNEIE